MNIIKKEIIPQEIKQNIDDVLSKELFNANRYYAESDANIAKLVEIEALKSPTDFLCELKNRWCWHNNFYENLLEPAYKQLVENNLNEYSLSHLKNLIEIYKTCCLVDEVTLVSSAAIKKHLNYVLSKFNMNKGNLSTEDSKFMLLTPPVETFFARFHIDHLNYILALKTKSPETNRIKENLLAQYHANDELIFEGRFNKSFRQYLDADVNEILDKINTYTITSDYKIRHYYFTIENPIKKAFNDILIYDNVDEKLISYQLIGISGFLFRKYILKELAKIGILPNKQDIYEFSKETIINALNKLLKLKEDKMEKDVTPYKQTGMTCTIACMLMILQYYKKIPKANKLYEHEYFRKYHSMYLEGTPFSAIAYHLAKNDLDTEIIHSSPNLFDNSSKTLSENVFKLSVDEYMRYLKAAEAKGARIKNGHKINTTMIRKCLEKDKMIIIAGQINKILHAILVCGYDKENFIVCDPLNKFKSIMTPQEVDKFMSTSLGKWCIVVGQTTKELKQLLKQIPKYQREAKNKLEN